MNTAIETRQNAPSIFEALRGAPHEFEFLQAIRLLNLVTAKAQHDDALDVSSQTPSGLTVVSQPVGYDHFPSTEIVRFRTHPSHSFPASEIADYDEHQYDDDDIGPPEMTVTFMGSTGPSGVLPRHYTQAVINQRRVSQGALWEFLDLFNHRQISLFYRAWEKYFFPVRYEREKSTMGSDEEDIFTHCLFSLIGFGTAGVRDRLVLDDEAFLFYSGQNVRQPRSAISLERMIDDHFETNSNVEQFLGEWLFLSAEDQTSLPTSTFSGFNTALGSETIIGDKVWGVEHRFRIRLGPMNYDDFMRYIPGADRHVELAQFVRTYVGPGLDFDLQPILEKEEVPSLHLEDTAPPQLGWNTWVTSLPMDEDVCDAVFDAEGIPIAK